MESRLFVYHGRYLWKGSLNEEGKEQQRERYEIQMKDNRQR